MDRTELIRRIRWAVTLILGIVLVASLVPIAEAATVINPLCGEIIGPGGNFVLGGDVGPCSTDPALTVDSAKLDLDGFMVSCDGTFNGINVVGEKSTVSNGTVSGCKDGIYVAGEGKHTLERVTSKNNGEDGFDVASDGNKLIGNTAKDNFDRGFNIAAGADKNELAGNMATGNGGTGFHIDGANNNKLSGNTAGSNGADGFTIRGGGNKLSRNLADENDGAGFGIPDGSNNNELSYNTASRNKGDDGFIIFGDSNKLGGNTSFNNSGDGFEITVVGNDNKLTGNLAVLNAVDGIRIADGGSNNDVLNNIAMGNGDVDLNDEGACDNTWKKNLFVTDNELDGPGAGCIQ